ncbi:MAG: alkaline phosphatase family protein, partial [Chloroflexota bacterium]|nr:alkaline phosphatase family protein [Chloroflexota bacterium]
MPNLIPDLLPKLHDHSLPALNLGENIIYPKYADQSILNIPDSICRWLKIPTLGAGPLCPEILAPVEASGDIRRLILILMDGLSLHRFQRWIKTDTPSVWNRLARRGLLAPLTSISPSTTTAAITSLWTGQSPAAHGIVGYEVWLKEYGIVANMILHSPMTFREGVGSLEKAGFDPEEFMALPTLGPHLRSHGVTPYAFQHYSIARSGLSQMFIRDTEIYPFSTPADLWISVRELLENKPNERIYAWTYWGAVDGLSHHHCPDDERTAAEFAHFSAAFEHFFLDRINAEAKKDTLVILTADHGQIYTPAKSDYLILKNHQKLNKMLHLRPSGENRLAYLFP